ncbi:unnamed protein product [Ambrosiozyma monospora]|uniref:Unnamed protein product n=1 Tax=Ambrosiozyma monospora TaxID=43982 RepID=A0A9W6Z7F5_AMBMO|nr:unnamed protein product [Ambrosiozyma monospora]
MLMPCSKDVLITLLSLLEQKAPIIYNDTEEFWGQLAIKAFNMLKRVTTFGYKRGAVLLKQKNDKDEIKKASDIVTNEFFSEQLLLNLVNLICNWYLKLKPSDLENWTNEPEEWINEELQASYEFQVRSCAENYFEDLATYFKELLAPFILQKIESSLTDPSVDILTKDSILCVFQLSAQSIANSCNFDKLFANYFLPESLKNESQNSSILKRRVCLIVSEWVSIQCSDTTRLHIYGLISSLLEPNGGDTVVKLTAIQTLQHLIDDWEFRKSSFQEFVGPIISNMIELLSGLQLTESKMFVLKVMSVLIERCNPLVPQKILNQVLRCYVI